MEKCPQNSLKVAQCKNRQLIAVNQSSTIIRKQMTSRKMEPPAYSLCETLDRTAVVAAARSTSARTPVPVRYLRYNDGSPSGSMVPSRFLMNVVLACYGACVLSCGGPEESAGRSGSSMQAPALFRERG